MENGSRAQVVLEVLEGGFDFGQLNLTAAIEIIANGWGSQ